MSDFQGKPPSARRCSFSKPYLLHSSSSQRDGAAASLGRRPGAASTAASCGVRRHTPLGPSPVPGATPRQVLETGRPEQKDRTCNDCVFNGLSGCQVRGSSIIRHFDPTQPFRRTWPLQPLRDSCVIAATSASSYGERSKQPGNSRHAHRRRLNRFLYRLQHERPAQRRSRTWLLPVRV